MSGWLLVAFESPTVAGVYRTTRGGKSETYSFWDGKEWYPERVSFRAAREALINKHYRPQLPKLWDPRGPVPDPTPWHLPSIRVQIALEALGVAY